LEKTGQLPGAIDWGVAGFDRFGAVGEGAGGYDGGEGQGLLGKLGQGLGLGNRALGLDTVFGSGRY
jgi:hypothetical protein